LNLTQEKIHFNNQNLLCVFIIFEPSVECSGYSVEFLNIDKISATTEGFIRDNEVYINKRVKNVKIYLEHNIEDIECTAKYLIKDQVVHYEKVDIHSNRNDYEEWHAPVVFTANKGMDFFKNRIHQKIFSELSVELDLKDDLTIYIKNNDKCLLFCLGTQSDELTASDLTFHIEKDIHKINVPFELLIKRFLNKKIAMHLLTKPDFRKDVNNLYYKSKISNEVEIKEKDIKIVNINEFKTPVNTVLDPLEWVIDWETQLPQYINV